MNKTIKPELTIIKETSFLDNFTCIERIDRPLLHSLIHSDKLRKSWNKDSYCGKRASKLYDTEKGQLEKYMNNFSDNDNGVVVEYTRPKHGYGRVFPKLSLAVTCFRKQIRNELIKKLYVDYDLKNAQPIILQNICHQHSIPCDKLDEYCNNRDEFLMKIVNHTNGVVSRDNAKTFVLSLLFNGSWSGFLEELELSDIKEPDCVIAMSACIKTISGVIKAHNKALYETVRKSKQDEGKEIKNLDGSFLSLYIQEQEVRIVGKVIEWVYNNVLTEKILSYEYDGFKLLESMVNDYLKKTGVTCFKTLLNEKTLELSGFKCEWEKKEIIGFSEGEITLLEIPIKVNASEYSRDYTEMKKQFETKHAKIIGLSVYSILSDDGVISFKKKNDFKTSYEHLHYDEQAFSKNGKSKTVSTKFLKTWLEDEHIKTYENVGVYPPPLVCPSNILNMWTPFAISKHTGDYVKDEDGLLSFKMHIAVLCNHQKDVYDYVIRWIAQMFQYPAIKTTCLTFISLEGAGKGSLMKLLSKMMGNRKVYESTKPSRDCWGNFNPMMNGAFLVNLNEMAMKEAADAEGSIKALITDGKLTINDKNISPFEIDSFHRFIIFSNNEDPIKVKSGDRRNVVIQSSNELVGNAEYFIDITKMFSDVTLQRTIYDYLMSIPDLENFQTSIRPITNYQQEMCELTRPLICRWVESFVQENLNENVLDYTGVEQYTLFSTWLFKNNIKYDINAISMGIRLARLNIPGVEREKHGGITKTYYDISKLKKHYKLGCILPL
jgi:hypothetical protein